MVVVCHGLFIHALFGANGLPRTACSPCSTLLSATPRRWLWKGTPRTAARGGDWLLSRQNCLAVGVPIGDLLPLPLPPPPPLPLPLQLQLPLPLLPPPPPPQPPPPPPPLPLLLLLLLPLPLPLPLLPRSKSQVLPWAALDRGCRI